LDDESLGPDPVEELMIEPVSQLMIASYPQIAAL